MTLRPYQTDLLNRVRAQWLSGARNVLMQLHTGGGKTKILAAEVKFANVPTAVLVHRNELVSQLSLALAREGIRHNLICNGAMRRLIIQAHIDQFGTVLFDPNSPVAVLSVQTAVRRLDHLKAWGRTVRLWVVDEGHHVVARNEWGKVVTELFTHPECRGLLPTATPLRSDGLGLGAHHDGLAHAIEEGPSGRWLIEQGYLSRYKVAVVDSHIRAMLGKVGPSGDWSNAKLREAFEGSEIAGDVTQSYRDFAWGKKGLTFAPSVEEAHNIAASYNAAGIPAAAMLGETPLDERQRIWAKLVARELLQVVAVDVIAEGVDVPAVEVLTLARPTASLGLHRQQIGRGLRPHPDKEFLQIIDHVGNFLEHRGGPDTPILWSLDRRVKRKSRDGEIPIVVCPNAKCGQPFERFRKCCPHCGAPLPPKAQRAGPAQVDGVLRLLDDETLARIRGDLESIDKPIEQYSWELAQRNVPAIGIAGHVKLLMAEQEAQRNLRAAMELWGGQQLAEGLTDDEMQAKFYLTFGIDVLSAKTLGIEDARKLTEAVVAGIPFDPADFVGKRLEEVWEEVCGYETREKFRKGSESAYQWARRNGVLDEVCAHMKGVVSWDLESVKAEALKYETRGAFAKGGGGALDWAHRNRVLGEVCAHMEKRR